MLKIKFLKSKKLRCLQNLLNIKCSLLDSLKLYRECNKINNFGNVSLFSGLLILSNNGIKQSDKVNKKTSFLQSIEDFRLQIYTIFKTKLEKTHHFLLENYSQLVEKFKNHTPEQYRYKPVKRRIQKRGYKIIDKETGQLYAYTTVPSDVKKKPTSSFFKEMLDVFTQSTDTLNNRLQYIDRLVSPWPNNAIVELQMPLKNVEVSLNNLDLRIVSFLSDGAIMYPDDMGFGKTLDKKFSLSKNLSNEADCDYPFRGFQVPNKLYFEPLSYVYLDRPVVLLKTCFDAFKDLIVYFGRTVSIILKRFLNFVFDLNLEIFVNNNRNNAQVSVQTGDAQSNLLSKFELVFSTRAEDLPVSRKKVNLRMRWLRIDNYDLVYSWFEPWVNVFFGMVLILGPLAIIVDRLWFEKLEVYIFRKTGVPVETFGILAAWFAAMYHWIGYHSYFFIKTRDRGGKAMLSFLDPFDAVQRRRYEKKPITQERLYLKASRWVRNKFNEPKSTLSWWPDSLATARKWLPWFWVEPRHHVLDKDYFFQKKHKETMPYKQSHKWTKRDWSRMYWAAVDYSSWQQIFQNYNLLKTQGKISYQKWNFKVKHLRSFRRYLQNNPPVEIVRDAYQIIIDQLENKKHTRYPYKRDRLIKHNVFLQKLFFGRFSMQHIPFYKRTNTKEFVKWEATNKLSRRWIPKQWRVRSKLAKSFYFKDHVLFPKKKRHYLTKRLFLSWKPKIQKHDGAAKPIKRARFMHKHLLNNKYNGHNKNYLKSSLYNRTGWIVQNRLQVIHYIRNLGKAGNRILSYQYKAKSVSSYQKQLNQHHTKLWSFFYLTTPGAALQDLGPLREYKPRSVWQFFQNFFGQDNVQNLLETNGARRKLVNAHKLRRAKFWDGIRSVRFRKNNPLPYKKLANPDLWTPPEEEIKSYKATNRKFSGTFLLPVVPHNHYRGQLKDIARTPSFFVSNTLSKSTPWAPPPFGPHWSYTSQMDAAWFRKTLGQESRIKLSQFKSFTDPVLVTPKKSLYIDQPKFRRTWNKKVGYKYWRALQPTLNSVINAHSHQLPNLMTNNRFASRFSWKTRYAIWQFSRRGLGAFRENTARYRVNKMTGRSTIGWLNYKRTFLKPLFTKQLGVQWRSANRAVLSGLADRLDLWHLNRIRRNRQSYRYRKLRPATKLRRFLKKSGDHFLARTRLGTLNLRKGFTWNTNVSFNPRVEGLGGFRRLLDNRLRFAWRRLAQLKQMQQWRDYYIETALQKNVTRLSFDHFIKIPKIMTSEITKIRPVTVYRIPRLDAMHIDAFLARLSNILRKKKTGYYYDAGANIFLVISPSQIYKRYHNWDEAQKIKLNWYFNSVKKYKNNLITTVKPIYWLVPSGQLIINSSFSTNTQKLTNLKPLNLKKFVFWSLIPWRNNYIDPSFVTNLHKNWRQIRTGWAPALAELTDKNLMRTPPARRRLSRFKIKQKVDVHVWHDKQWRELNKRMLTKQIFREMAIPRPIHVKPAGFERFDPSTNFYGQKKRRRIRAKKFKFARFRSPMRIHKKLWRNSNILSFFPKSLPRLSRNLFRDFPKRNVTVTPLCNTIPYLKIVTPFKFVSNVANNQFFLTEPYINQKFASTWYLRFGKKNTWKNRILKTSFHKLHKFRKYFGISNDIVQMPHLKPHTHFRKRVARGRKFVENRMLFHFITARNRKKKLLPRTFYKYYLVDKINHVFKVKNKKHFNDVLQPVLTRGLRRLTNELEHPVLGRQKAKKKKTRAKALSGNTSITREEFHALLKNELKTGLKQFARIPKTIRLKGRIKDQPFFFESKHLQYKSYIQDRRKRFNYTPVFRNEHLTHVLRSRRRFPVDLIKYNFKTSFLKKKNVSQTILKLHRRPFSQLNMFKKRFFNQLIIIAKDQHRQMFKDTYNIRHQWWRREISNFINIPNQGVEKLSSFTEQPKTPLLPTKIRAKNYLYNVPAVVRNSALIQKNLQRVRRTKIFHIFQRYSLFVHKKPEFAKHQKKSFILNFDSLFLSSNSLHSSAFSNLNTNPVSPELLQLKKNVQLALKSHPVKKMSLSTLNFENKDLKSLIRPETQIIIKNTPVFRGFAIERPNSMDKHLRRYFEPLRWVKIRQLEMARALIFSKFMPQTIARHSINIFSMYHWSAKFKDMYDFNNSFPFKGERCIKTNLNMPRLLAFARNTFGLGLVERRDEFLTGNRIFQCPFNHLNPTTYEYLIIPHVADVFAAANPAFDQQRAGEILRLNITHPNSSCLKASALRDWSTKLMFNWEPEPEPLALRMPSPNLLSDNRLISLSHNTFSGFVAVTIDPDLSERIRRIRMNATTYADAEQTIVVPVEARRMAIRAALQDSQRANWRMSAPQSRFNEGSQRVEHLQSILDFMATPAVEEKVAVAESAVEEKVAVAESAVEEKVAVAPRRTRANWRMSAPQSRFNKGSHQMSAPQSRFNEGSQRVEHLQSILDFMATPAVEEKVAVAESAVEEKVAVAESAVEEKVAVAESAVEEKVAVAESAVEEKVAVAESAVEEKVAVAESAVEEKVAVAESAVEEKVTEIDFQRVILQSAEVSEAGRRARHNTFLQGVKVMRTELNRFVSGTNALGLMASSWMPTYREYKYAYILLKQAEFTYKALTQMWPAAYFNPEGGCDEWKWQLDNFLRIAAFRNLKDRPELIHQEEFMLKLHPWITCGRTAHALRYFYHYCFNVPMPANFGYAPSRIFFDNKSRPPRLFKNNYTAWFTHLKYRFDDHTIDYYTDNRRHQFLQKQKVPFQCLWSTTIALKSLEDGVRYHRTVNPTVIVDLPRSETFINFMVERAVSVDHEEAQHYLKPILIEILEYEVRGRPTVDVIDQVQFMENNVLKYPTRPFSVVFEKIQLNKAARESKKNNDDKLKFTTSISRQIDEICIDTNKKILLKKQDPNWLQ